MIIFYDTSFKLFAYIQQSGAVSSPLFFSINTSIESEGKKKSNNHFETLRPNTTAGISTSYDLHRFENSKQDTNFALTKKSVKRGDSKSFSMIKNFSQSQPLPSLSRKKVVEYDRNKI